MMKQQKYTAKQILCSLRRVDTLNRGLMEVAIAHAGIHQSQHMVLMRIACMEKPCSQAELARQMEVSPPAMAVNVRKLEEAGYVTRETNKMDKRYNRVLLTDKGKALVEESRQVFNQVDAKMFQGFTEEEMEQLAGFIERMRENLQK